MIKALISDSDGTPAELTEAGAIRVVNDLQSISQLIEGHNRGENLLF